MDIMFLRIIVVSTILLSLFGTVYGKCSLPQVKTSNPYENDGIYLLSLVTNNETEYKYLPDQTYVLTLSSKDPSRTFRWFMITAEDPDADNQEVYRNEPADTGSLKPLDGQTSRYSERCPNSVENSDNTEKTYVEIHWISPKKNADTKNVRISAIVAKNEEMWYNGDNLTVTLHKDDGKLLDSPPLQPMENCNLCSEAQYEVIFRGKWSRLTHPRHFPSVPDENGYSHMVGASHAFNYTLWDRGITASDGLKQVAEAGNIATMERDIINAMSVTGGTRTLIRGKRCHHPHMFEPSYSLLRVDRIHHLFSLVVAMRPSPDWFLGVAKFELCTPNGWYEHAQIPLYPWDAGTDEGISYKSPKSPMSPADTVERVAVGSFDKASPFFQLNLNALKPFAFLEVRRLNVYPVKCETEEPVETPAAESNDEVEAEAVIKPLLAESKLDQAPSGCVMDWSEWSQCQPFHSNCGPGSQTRTQYEGANTEYYDKNADEVQLTVLGENCQRNDEALTETRPCYINCL